MRRLIQGVNDLKSWCEQNGMKYLLDEWDYTQNAPLSPENITYGSHERVHWVCRKCGHPWKANIHNRVRTENSRGCPVCGKKKQQQAAEERHLDNGTFRDWCNENGCEFLLDEWDNESNFPDSPDTVAWGNSSCYFWWICPFCGGKYRSRVDHRRRGCGHRMCKPASLHNSDAEIGVLYYAQIAFGNDAVIPNYHDNDAGVSEIDVFIPSLKVGIEYDGEGYHDVTRDIRKDQACTNAGITLYRIREPKCPIFESTSICVRRSRTAFNADYDEALIWVFKNLGVDVDVNSQRDQGHIIALRGRQIKKNSLAAKFPEIAKEWDYEANYPLTPEMVSYGADRLVSWICSRCGNHYKSVVYSRTGKKRHGCSECGRRMAAKAKSIAVKQYSLNGEYLATFPSASEAAHAIGKDGYSGISSCCAGRYKSAGGFYLEI